MPRIRFCPACHSSRVSRSQKRNLLEKALAAMASFRPYRCLDCDARFFQGKSGHGGKLVEAGQHSNYPEALGPGK